MKPNNSQPPPQQKPQQKFCPLLSMAIIKPPSPLTLPSGQQDKGFQMVACQEGACAFYLVINNEHGQRISGACCMTVLPQAMATVSQTIVAVAQGQIQAAAAAAEAAEAPKVQ